MLKMQGTIKSMKVTVGANTISRQVTFDVGDDAIFDDLQEIMRAKDTLNIILQKQQLEMDGSAGKKPSPFEMGVSS